MLKNNGKSLKNINMLILAPYYYYSMLLYQWQFNKSFQSVGRYENHLICIFVNIYENLKYKAESWKNLRVIKIYFATSGQFLLDAIFSMGPQNMILKK